MSAWFLLVALIAVVISTPFAVIVVVEEPPWAYRPPTRSQVWLFIGCLACWMVLVALIKIGRF